MPIAESAPSHAPCLLEGRPAEVVETIVREGLLPESLIRRLRVLHPDAPGLSGPGRRLFEGRDRYSGLQGFRDLCGVLEANGIEIGHREERELFIDVYRFLATRHTLNSIDWDDFESDPMFRLVFPQPGMIRREFVERYAAATTREGRRRVAADCLEASNPHDGHQLLNKPWLTNADGEVEILEGCQHKYPQIQLVFDRTTQNCFSFCTYCFRHAQVRGDDDMFVQEDVGQVHEYLRAHPEVSDLLITGGDAGFMPPERFEEYVTPILEDPELFHVRTVRLGSRALSYEPEKILRRPFEGMLAQFDRLYDHGVQVAWMAHFSFPSELLNPITLAAIRRLQAHHVVLRSQSPIMRHVSLFEAEDGTIDVERSARNWIDLGHLLEMLSIGFHSIYCARPTGEHHYFTAPLADVHRVFDRVYRALPSIARPSRHLSMTTSAGKISILGLAEVGGEKVFALKFSEGRNMEWLDPVFLARWDPSTENVAKLEPLEGEDFFFGEQLEAIEAELAARLEAEARA